MDETLTMSKDEYRGHEKVINENILNVIDQFENKKIWPWVDYFDIDKLNIVENSLKYSIKFLHGNILMNNILATSGNQGSNFSDEDLEYMDERLKMLETLVKQLEWIKKQYFFDRHCTYWVREVVNENGDTEASKKINEAIENGFKNGLKRFKSLDLNRVEEHRFKILFKTLTGRNQDK